MRRECFPRLAHTRERTVENLLQSLGGFYVHWPFASELNSSGLGSVLTSGLGSALASGLSSALTSGLGSTLALGFGSALASGAGSVLTGLEISFRISRSAFSQ